MPKWMPNTIRQATPRRACRLWSVGRTAIVSALFRTGEGGVIPGIVAGGQAEVRYNRRRFRYRPRLPPMPARLIVAVAALSAAAVAPAADPSYAKEVRPFL